jgi:hypothetical protein
MSKNNKNAKRIAARKEMSKLRLGGGSGPARTAAKHGKKNAWWQRFPSYGAFVRGGKKASRMQDVETVSE